MPSRKSGSSEATLSDSRRTSLRRLSSIASFQNLFIRRRSNNATDQTANSSSSNLSVTSTTVNAPGPTKKYNGSTSESEQGDTVTELPLPPLASQAPARRSSYICLPDDPIGGMPRSRTFSNLPVPTRTKKTMPSKSHSRLPSAFLPSTRLPSPPMSTRKHSHSRLFSMENKAPPVRNRIKRSDTEPLLGVDVQQQSHLPRSTAFKENISLSPIKPLPARDMFHHKDQYSSSPPSQQYHSAHTWSDTSSEGSDPCLSGTLPFGSSPPYANHPAVQIAREHKSSPAYRSSRDRPPTPGASALEPMAAQRWKSQPILTNRSNNRRNSHVTEIKQPRLMSARQAPTPPPKTPLATSQAPASTKPKTTNVNQHTTHAPILCDSTNSTSSQPKPTNTSPPKTKPIPRHHLTISTSEPPAYWSGRLSALTDRYRNAELLQHLSRPASHPSPKTQTHKMHTPEASIARLHKALEFLEECCTTAEARESLRFFRGTFAVGMKLPELKPRLGAGIGVENGGGGGGASGASGGGEDSAMATMSENRKVSFMDRLLGRQKRRSLVLV